MLTIRIAEQKDFDVICRLMQNELGYLDLNVAEAFKRLEFFKTNENFETFVAEKETEIVGFIGVMKSVAYNYDGYYSQIMALAVSEKEQGKGIGTELVKKVEEWSLDNGINSIGVNSGLHRLKTHEFYEKNGYKKGSYSFGKRI